jgi:hypothetical protein
MKKSDLRFLIREAISEVNSEKTRGGKSIYAMGAPGSKVRSISTNDPTREEMLSFLQQQFGGGEDGFQDSAEVAMYWFANHYHGGQWSNLYSVLSTSPFRPGPTSRGPEPDSMEADMYQALEAEYGGQNHQHKPHAGEEDTALEEDGADGGSAAGPGGLSTTSNIQGYSTPRAFKHPKNLPAHRLNEMSPEDEDALYVEYVRQMPNETSFMMGNQKFEYVQAKYPSGKVDIGVYAFAGDVVYGYNAFRKMHNIKEEEQPEPYDSETDQFAPGPRQRPEDWGKPEEPKHLPINESVPKRILKLKDLLK